MRKVLSYLRPYRRHLVVGPVFKLAEAVLELYLPLLVARMVDLGVAGHDVGLVWHYGILCLILAVAGLGCALVCQYTASYASQGYGTAVRNALFAKINRLPMVELDRFGTSSLVNRLGGDINLLQQAVAMLIRLVVRAPFLSIGGLVMALAIDRQLSLVFLLVLPLFTLILYGVMFRAIPLYRQIQNKGDRLTRMLLEHLAGIRVVRAFAQRRKESSRFSAANDDLAQTMIRVGKVANLLNPATQLILNAAVVAVIWLGGSRVDTGAVTRGQIIAFTNYLGQILLALIVLANLVLLYTRAYAAALRVEEVFAATEQPAGNDTGCPAVVLPGEPMLVFDRVSFRYPAAQDYLFRDFSLTVKQGSTLGIIGPTGSGKSTLAWLLYRMWPIDSGAIYLAGRDIREYPEAALRDLLSIVPQQALLFSGTVADNLQMAKPDATEAEMWQALDIAQASGFIRRQDHGLQTQVERGGRNFSGGQRQRLTLARALLRRPALLILDDSTSALDYETDAAFRHALADSPAFAGLTCLLISQRIAAVREAGQILVLDDGRPVGLGNHHQLLLENETYQELYRSQTGSGEEPAAVPAAAGVPGDGKQAGYV